MEAEIGIIGGSGLYNMPGLSNRREQVVETPWGNPSDAYVLGELAGRKVAFLARHGRGHRIMPSNLNFRANIYGMKKLGVQWILSFSAVGSLQERLKPLDFCIPDQFFDRTRGRISTFFDEDVVVHIGFADPVCPLLAGVAELACRKVGVTVHRGGTYCCMEGPAFSTRAESNLYRSWGFDVIGMTNLQEAKLAREAEMSYATVAMVTDYDCWHPDHDAVTVDQVIAYLTKNSENAQAVAEEAVRNVPAGPSPHASALKIAKLTDRQTISDASRKKYDLLLWKYLK
jgi:5'-methylthioadenosine phosphorylase